MLYLIKRPIVKLILAYREMKHSLYIKYLRRKGFQCGKAPRLHAGSEVVREFHNLVVGDYLILGKKSVINSGGSHGIYIGNHFLAAQDVFIRSSNHDYSFSEEPFQKRGHVCKKIDWNGKVYSIVIEDDVWVGRGATILSGAHIGKGCVIGAGAVIKEKIPPYSIVIGNPAQIVSNRVHIKDFNDRNDITVLDE